jgi:hypothetical protein
MARKSRLELRREAEVAEKLENAEGADGAAAKPAKKAAAKKTAAKKPAASRSKKAKKVDPTRLRLVWGVFDNSNQQIATFPYSDRAAADAKVVEMMDKGRGPYFVQPVKEPMPLAPPAEQ